MLYVVFLDLLVLFSVILLIFIAIIEYNCSYIFTEV